jgi:hypothetical protein
VNRKYVFHVYDRRTTMSEFVASFAVREHADKWAREMFGEFGYVSDRGLHQSSQMWDGTPWREPHSTKGENS